MGSSEPFLGSEAVRSGMLRPHQLRSRFRAVYPDVYVRRDQQLTLRHRAVAAWRCSRRRGVLAGLTAAAWHGSKWVDERLPIELVWSTARPPRGLRTYDVRLGPEEYDLVGGIPVTTPQRTAYDVGRRKPMGAAIAYLDALLGATNVKLAEVAEVADRHRGARGLRQLETALELVDTGSQSPKESWLRLLIIGAGLPRPTTQVPVATPDGTRMYYLDMGWPDVMVAVEDDGEHHGLDRWQYTRDIRRSEQWERLGWLIVRVVATDRPADIIRRIRAALEFRGSRLR